MQPLIRTEHLSKFYKIDTERIIALDDICLAVERGEICCILGTSGSGKSTLLNMLAGLEKPSRGEIYIGKTDIAHLSEAQLAIFRRRHIGFIFQSYNLLPEITALENVALPLCFKGIDKKERNRKAARMLDLVGLSARMRHRPTQMSGGQQQRVGIARAFVTEPKIVFADEPTGNLDSHTTREVMELMVGLARQHNQTLILVTHDDQIARYADRIIHIIDGCIDRVQLNERPLGPVKREEPSSAGS